MQGSQRVAKEDLGAWVERVPNVMALDPVAASRWLNARPATVRGKWVWPERAIRDAVAAL